MIGPAVPACVLVCVTSGAGTRKETLCPGGSRVAWDRDRCACSPRRLHPNSQWMDDGRLNGMPLGGGATPNLEKPSPASGLPEAPDTPPACPVVVWSEAQVTNH
uniref:Uncharacterized protein n=1 Tax=Neurospora crassa TaxID=5141 RepID=Q9P441_NEUCS|nr:unknown [Neurospora crassa]